MTCEDQNVVAVLGTTHPPSNSLLLSLLMAARRKLKQNSAESNHMRVRGCSGSRSVRSERPVTCEYQEVIHSTLNDIRSQVNKPLLVVVTVTLLSRKMCVFAVVLVVGLCQKLTRRPIEHLEMLTRNEDRDARR